MLEVGVSAVIKVAPLAPPGSDAYGEGGKGFVHTSCLCVAMYPESRCIVYFRFVIFKFSCILPTNTQDVQEEFALCLNWRSKCHVGCSARHFYRNFVGNKILHMCSQCTRLFPGRFSSLTSRGSGWGVGGGGGGGGGSGGGEEGSSHVSSLMLQHTFS